MHPLKQVYDFFIFLGTSRRHVHSLSQEYYNKTQAISFASDQNLHAFQSSLTSEFISSMRNTFPIFVFLCTLGGFFSLAGGNPTSLQAHRIMTWVRSS